MPMKISVSQQHLNPDLKIGYWNVKRTKIWAAVNHGPEHLPRIHDSFRRDQGAIISYIRSNPYLIIFPQFETKSRQTRF